MHHCLNAQLSQHEFDSNKSDTKFQAFTKLKTSLPWVPPDTKLSKLDTLRLASSYIRHLRQILAEEQAFPSTAIHPINLVRDKLFLLAIF